MSSRNWRHHAPLGVGIAGVVVLLAIAGLVGQYKEAERAYRASEQQYEESKRIEPVGGSGPNRPYTDPKAYREEWRAERNLEAQWSMAKWTMLGALATVGGIVILVATLLDGIRATRAATRAVEVQIRIEQPLLFVEHIRDHLPMERMDLIVRNLGKTPAILVGWSVHCEIVAALPPKPAYGRLIRRRGIVIRPDSVRPNIVPVVLEESIASAISSEETAHLWGHLRYEDVFGRVHITGFGYRCDPYLDEADEPALGLLWSRAGGTAYNYDREDEA